MPFAVFQNENVADGISQNSAYQVGISDVDPGTLIEQGILIPFVSQSGATYLYYDAWLEIELDDGIVVHRQLPQVATAPDLLGTTDMFDAALEQNTTDGVNTISVGRFTDTVQRMAHSIYRFNLRGIALRLAYPVPIPVLKSVGGVPAIPDDEIRQKAYNKIAGNYSGVSLYKAEWSLWYTVSVPPNAQQVAPPNLAEHIRATDTLPTGQQSPWTSRDTNAVDSAPAGLVLLQGVQGG